MGEDLRGYLAEVERSHAALANHREISSTGLGHGQTLGFVLVKMIDEYALHSGQAHMIRFAALGRLVRQVLRTPGFQTGVTWGSAPA